MPEENAVDLKKLPVQYWYIIFIFAWNAWWKGLSAERLLGMLGRTRAGHSALWSRINSFSQICKCMRQQHAVLIGLLAYWMIYGGSGFLEVAWFGSSLTTFSPSPHVVSVSQSSCVSPGSCLLMGGVGAADPGCLSRIPPVCLSRILDPESKFFHPGSTVKNISDPDTHQRIYGK
jgi:hypothetical protein